MKSIYKIFTVGLILSLAACGSADVVTDTKTIDTPHLNYNLPPAVSVQPIQWKVYTATDLKKLSTDKNVVLFTLTKQEYEKLGRNMAEVHRYILQLKDTVNVYRTQNAATTK